ncbi:MAG: M16 family metallopeptidase, partial [Candidatus Krumholzibacteriia bacterium]
LALEQLAAIQDNPFQAAAVRLRELMYGDHPYGRPLQGTAASLPGLDRAAVLARHAAALGIPADGPALAALVAPHLGEPAAAEPAPATAARPAPAVTARAARAAAPAPFRVHAVAPGVDVWLRRDPSVPVVCMSLVVPGGATGETADHAGLTALAQQVQVKGAGGRDAATLHAALEGGGAVVSPLSLRDYGGLSFSALADRLEPALDLLALVVQQPDFPAHEIDQERRLALEQLAAIQDNPFQAAAVRLRELMYGDHPYGRPLQGTAASLPGLDRAAVLARHAAAWTAGAVQVVASGDLDEDRFLARIGDLLAGLPAGAPAAAPALAPARAPDGVVHERIVRRQNQAVLLVGWPGPRDADDRRVPLMLLREVLNGQSGRLFEALRNRCSLCYNTGLASTSGFGQGMLLGYVLTAPDTAQQAGELLVQQIGALRDEPVPAAEFARARTQLLGSLLIGTQGNAARTARAARARAYGRPTDDLEQVVAAIASCTPTQVQEAAAALVMPEARFEVLLGP